jgi:hypothetical protein
VASLPDFDYWLFDSSRLYVLRFTDEDSLIGAEQVIDAARIVAANAARCGMALRRDARPVCRTAWP